MFCLALPKIKFHTPTEGFPFYSFSLKPFYADIKELCRSHLSKESENYVCHQTKVQRVKS